MGLLLLAAAGFARLGVWQLSRLRERRAANVDHHRGAGAPPVTLAPRDRRTRRSLAERRVVATGRYDHGRRDRHSGRRAAGDPGRPDRDAAAAWPGGPAVLVDRGFLPAPDAVTVDTKGTEEPGEVTVRGVALPVPAGPGEPIEHGDRTTWRRLDRQALRRRLPYPLLPIYIRQSPGQLAPELPAPARARRRWTRGRTWAMRCSGFSSRGWRRRSRCWWWDAAGLSQQTGVKADPPLTTRAAPRPAARWSWSTAPARAAAGPRWLRPGAARGAGSGPRAS